MKQLMLGIVLIPLSPVIWADGLSDLKSALTKLSGHSSIHARLESSFAELDGKGKDKKKREGRITVKLADGMDGLTVSYSNEVIRRIEEESHKKVENEDAPTPTLSAANDLRTTDLREILSSASSMLLLLKQAKFISETKITRGKNQLRDLSFELPMESLISSKKAREYVKRFQGGYTILIDEQGVPVESKLSYSGRGRAYIVLSIKASGEIISTYKVIDDRLVCAHNKSKSAYSSTFGAREIVSTTQLYIDTEH